MKKIKKKKKSRKIIKDVKRKKMVAWHHRGKKKDKRK